MKLNTKSVRVVMAQKSLSLTDVAKNYGSTRQRISCILNSVNITPRTAGKLASALGVDVTEIIED